MQPLRNQIHSQLQQRTYTLDELAKQYRTTTSVIQVQLDRLKSEGKQITVTDDEVSAYVRKIDWLCTAWFYGIITFALAYLVTH